VEEEEAMTTRRITIGLLLLCTLGAARAAAAPPKDAGGLDTAAIEELTGAKGALDAKEGAFKVTLPRSDTETLAKTIKSALDKTKHLPPSAP
jgi:hypothetical protein